MPELRSDPIANPVTTDDYDYWAFISYSSQDLRVARWLKEALVREAVPPGSRNWTKERKKTFEDVFIDEASLSAGARVDEGLQRALRKSRNLIVVCSPFAVASRYVDDEIAYFMKLGRANKIICLVASGIPNATDDGKPQFECFPSALRFEINPDGTISDSKKPVGARPLAAVLGLDTPADKRQVLQRIVAGLLGISIDQLRRLRQRRALKRVAVAAACLAILGGVAELAWVNYFKPTQSYYQNFQRRFAKWEGYDQVSAEKAKQLDEVYEFTTKGKRGRVERVRFINGSGFCPDSGMKSILGNSLQAHCTYSRACEARLKYSSDDHIESETMLDSFGVPLETLTYNAPSVATFVEAGYGCERTQSGIQYVAIKRYEGGEARGLMERIEFQGPGREPRTNHDRAYGLRYEYDGMRPRSVTFLDRNGQAKIGPDGYSGWRGSYGSDNRMVLGEYLLPSGAAAVTKDGYSKIKYASDELGRFVEEAYQDSDGRPVLTRDGIAGQSFKYDSRGNIAEVLMFGLRHERALSKSGVSARRSTHDEKGRLTERVFLGLDDKPVHNKDGFAILRMKYDRQGNAIEVSTYAADALPVAQKSGTAVMQAKYDDRGRRLEETLLDAERKPAPDKDGMTTRQNLFDDQGRRIGSKYFDGTGKLTARKVCFAEIRHTLDSRGNMIAETRIGPDGNPVAKEGIATIRYKVDEHGHQTEATYFGVDGQITVDMNGNAGWRSKFDDRGNESETIFLGIDGNPTSRAMSWRAKFDERGNQTELLYVGIDGKPTIGKGGFAGERVTHDKLGNAVEITNLGIDGKPVLGADGYAGSRSKFDALGNLTELSYFNIDGKPTVIKRGFAGWRSKFDAYGNRTEIAYIGIDNKPVLSVDGHAGWRSRFDVRGNLVEMTYFDIAGKPINRKDGISTTRYKYDDRGNELERMFFNADGNRATGAEGFAGWRSRYDDNNNNIETAFLAVNGDLTANRAGIVVERVKYDQCGNRIERTFFDVSGQPSVTNSGNHRNLYFYDSWSRQIRAEYYGLDGKRAVLVGTMGGVVSAISKKYDLFGQLVEEQYFDRDEEPIAGENGTQRISYAYDNRGGLIGTSRYDVNGKEMPSP